MMMRLFLLLFLLYCVVLGNELITAVATNGKFFFCVQKCASLLDKKSTFSKKKRKMLPSSQNTTLFVVCEIGSYNNFESSSLRISPGLRREIHRVIEKDHQ